MTASGKRRKTSGGRHLAARPVSSAARPTFTRSVRTAPRDAGDNAYDDAHEHPTEWPDEISVEPSIPHPGTDPIEVTTEPRQAHPERILSDRGRSRTKRATR